MPTYYEFEVSLSRVKPRIWRRFLLSTEATFIDLHEAIQDSSGWFNCHLFEFKDEKARSIAGLPESEFDKSVADASNIPLASYFGDDKAKRCSYEYDFGDGWVCEVTLSQVESAEKFWRRILAGERAFPPEDCGGLPGYSRCVKAIYEKVIRFKKKSS